jgi:beta-1,4-N-acetylglucosaminyltransferase
MLNLFVYTAGIVLGTALLFLALRIIFNYIFNFLNSISGSKSLSSCKTLIVFGSGGHTAEMLAILKRLPKDRYKDRIYVKAETDLSTRDRAVSSKIIPPSAEFINIPRSREVGQSYFTSIFSTVYAFWFSLYLVYSSKPDLILCNGPGTCLPICYAAFFLRAGGEVRTKVVFIESVCRVKSLSLTGKLLYPLVDEMQVQWQELQDKYPRTKYIGMIL